MKHAVPVICMILFFTVTSVLGAGSDKVAFETWCQEIHLVGYSYGGIKENDPGVYTAAWKNTTGDIIGVQLHPLSNFPAFLQPVKFTMPVLFTYKKLSAIYTDALHVGQVAVKYEKSDRVLMITQIDPTGQTKPITKEELSILLDQIKPELILQ